jgi:hypothetical protein
MRFGLPLLALALAGAARGQDKATADFHQDFRNQPLAGVLRLLNDPTGALCRTEPTGLRVAVPKSLIYASGDGVGIQALVPLHGDFEVIATIELLDVETPRSGAGAGVALYLPTVAGAGALLGRVVDMNGRHVILCGRHSPALAKKDPTWERHATFCADDKLSLRLRRTGPTLSYQFAPGTEGTDYHELQRLDFGGDDIKHVRFSAINNRTHCALDVRLIDLHIRSGAGIVEPAGVALSSNGTRRWHLSITLLGCAAVLAAAWLFWVLARRKKPE